MHVDSAATKIEPPRRLAMDFRSRYFAGHLTYDITATEGGTIVRQREILLPRRHLQWAGPWIQRRLEPRVKQRLENLKSLMEAAPAGAAPP
jgi:hypothetical protein